MADAAPSLYPEYDHAFELKLCEVIIGAITRASRVNGVPILRSTEIVGALTGALGHFLTLAGATRDEDTVEQSIVSIMQLLVEHMQAAQDQLDMRTQAGRA